ncbi:MAG: hypothetical protein IT342_12435 [Candidatus Melainabacteria bacterium]|nr:hypothetical protein [Candidatus Melainabacteria bacterium]
MASTGVSTRASKFILLGFSLITATFSIGVGLLFVTGSSDLLPDLTQNWSSPPEIEIQFKNKDVGGNYLTFPKWRRQSQL